MKSKALIYVITALFSLTFIANSYAQRKKLGSTVQAITAEDLNRLNLNQDLSDLSRVMPKNLVEAGAGIGATNDFENIRWCIRGGAITRIAVIEDKAGVYTGVDVMYESSDQDSFTTNMFAFGGKFQLNSFITRTGEIQWLNGIKGHYVTGKQKFDSLEDDVSGLMGCYYTGVQAKVGDGVFVSAETNVFVLEDLTIKSESGFEFEQDNSALRLNQGNLVNFTVRWEF